MRRYSNSIPPDDHPLGVVPIGRSIPNQNKFESDYTARTRDMQAWWEDAHAKHLSKPRDYTNVAVLLIKWEDELDDLHCAEELHELETLFREKFNFCTRIVQIGIRGRPQLQLDREVSDFIYSYDGPHNLLIVYYIGHGRYLHKEKYLEITGSQRNPLISPGFLEDARANWNKVEEKLQDDEVEGNILEILATCYASNLPKTSKLGSRKFEVLSACLVGQTTAAPGDHSFTRTLIDALEKLVKDHGNNPFSTFTLNECIVQDERRWDTPSALWQCLQRIGQTEQHILLTPIRRSLIEDRGLRLGPKGYLTLRFGLRKETLVQEQIELMTHMLSRMMKTVGLRSVDWVDVRRAPEMTYYQRVAIGMSVVKRWKRVIAKHKEERKARSSSPVWSDWALAPAARSESDQERSGLAQPWPLKRSIEDRPGLTQSEKRYPGGVEPPSPPVSDSSRMDQDV